MGHAHAHAHRDHVANLQARSPDSDVTVVYVTLSADFDGPIGGYVTMSQTSSDKSDKATAGLGAPIQQTRSSSKEETTTSQTSEKTKAEATATATKDSDRQSTTTQKAEQTTHASQAATTEQASTAQTTFQTSSSSSTSAITGLEDAAVTASSTSVPAASASPTAMSASQGLTGGAKAGIAIGVIVAVSAIAVFILLWLRKKKQGQHVQEIDPENEKYVRQEDIAPPPPPKPESVTSPSPPQLNIRPVTQFAPFASDFASNGGAAGLSAGGSLAPVAESAVVSRSLTDHPSPPQTPKSSSHGSDPFGDPVNPFSNGAEAPSPLASSTALSIASAPVPQAEETASTPEETAPAETEQISPVVSAAESEPVAEDAIVTGVAAAAAVVGVAAVATSTSKTQEKQLPVSPGDSGTGSQAIPQEAVLDDIPTPTTPSTPFAAPVAAPVVAPGPRPPPSGPAPPPPGNVHRVQMDFNPSMEDELELHFGQLVRLLHEYDDGWALCTRLDRSQQGVVPRSCLSSRPLKPRPPPGPGARGPPMAAPNRPMPPRPTTPSSNFNPPVPRPQSPARPMSPGQPSYAGPGPMPLRLHNQRPMSPAQGPPAPRSFSPGPGPRPMVPRSMSPGPYGLPGMQKPHMPASQRPRSNSTGAAMGPNPRQGGFPGPSPLGGPMMPPVSTIPRATPTLVESPISETGNREW
ncbi:hypothetical protein BO86DRAFT_122521 [Aspergillus japonicus CBS 114.51]|uniref:SH3 domain-containing protein n=1 Tax=Aspergillus japonicus CBS 114.51 TaxID=1448312 RepID=A0A8T8WYH4_ASPJA|nr:hypothetical protein BO86DRAFT_122521 [Aspergillus japonicus CBS 114.51]RAH80714.1 hypothetical protein BO86DRAFT_122521 [Aspergillus japonicus CBS 114.51]